MQMEIDFPGGKRVNATYKGFVVQTDQPRSEGGEGSAPEPFDLFLAAIGTCAGVYVAYFCEHRNIPTDRIRMRLSFENNPQSHLVEKISVDIHLPPGFPSRYRKAVVRAAASCAVKRNLIAPPLIQVKAIAADSAG